MQVVIPPVPCSDRGNANPDSEVACSETEHPLGLTRCCDDHREAYEDGGQPERYELRPGNSAGYAVFNVCSVTESMSDTQAFAADSWPGARRVRVVLKARGVSGSEDLAACG